MNDLKHALLDPTSVFEHPSEVLQRDDLSDEQKIEILHRWEYDARELQVASEENMPPNNASTDLLDEVLKALHKLGVWQGQ